MIEDLQARQIDLERLAEDKVVFYNDFMAKKEVEYSGKVCVYMDLPVCAMSIKGIFIRYKRYIMLYNCIDGRTPTDYRQQRLGNGSPRRAARDCESTI